MTLWNIPRAVQRSSLFIKIEQNPNMGLSISEAKLHLPNIASGCLSPYSLNRTNS